MFKRHNFTSSAEWYRKAIKIDAQEPVGHNLLGLAYRNMREFDKSYAHYLRAFQLGPAKLKERGFNANFRAGVRDGTGSGSSWQQIRHRKWSNASEDFSFAQSIPDKPYLKEKINAHERI